MCIIVEKEFVVYCLLDIGNSDNISIMFVFNYKFTLRLVYNSFR